MTELERARANLRYQQYRLHKWRSVPDTSPTYVSTVEEDVLAALSWVWDAQERDNEAWARSKGMYRHVTLRILTSDAQ